MSLTGFAFTRCGRWIGNGERALRFVLPPLLLDVLDDPSTEARHATSVTLARSQLWLRVNEPGDPGEQLPRLVVSGSRR
jgi:hypothetical protein